MTFTDLHLLIFAIWLIGSHSSVPEVRYISATADVFST